MAPILNRTPLASIAFADGNGAHIRVYYQDASGDIRETFYDDKNGWAQRELDVVGKGKLNTGIAATTWDNGTQIRVYFLSPDSTIVERCYTGGAAGSWFDGALTKKQFRAAPYSQIGAVPFSQDKHDARVYYQDSDNKVREVVLNPSTETWSQGSASFPVATPGTAISAVSSTDRPGQRVWVYYQQADMKPVEYLLYSKGSWGLGGYKPSGTFAPGASISAIHWGNYNIRVLAVNDQNELVATEWNINNGWHGTKKIGPVITNSQVAGIHVPTTSDWIRAYDQPSGNTISEKGSNDGGSSWSTMQSVIPVEH